MCIHILLLTYLFSYLFNDSCRIHCYPFFRRAQPMLRWLCNVAQVEFSLSSWGKYLSLTHSFSVISEIAITRDHTAENWTPCLHFYRTHFSLASTSLTLSLYWPRDRPLRRSRSFENTNFGINGKPACDFLRSVSEIWRIIGSIFAVNADCLSLKHSFWMNL